MNAGDFFDNDYYRSIKRYLVLSGLYPYRNRRTQFPNFQILVTIMMSLVVPQIKDLNQAIDDYDVDHIIMSLPSLFTSSVCFVKIFNLQLNKKKFIKIFDLIKEEWTIITAENELRILHKYTEEGRKVTEFYMSYVVIALTLFLLMPLVPAGLDVIMPLNESRKLHPLYESDYLVDTDEYYIPIYVHECACTYCAIFAATTVDILYMLLSYHACGLFSVCGYQLKKVTESLEEDVKQRKKSEDYVIHRELRRCIITHKRAIEFADFMAASSSVSYLLQLGVNMIAISVTGVQTVMKLHEIEEATRFGLFTFSMNIHLFVVTLPGQKLFDSSTELADSIYCTDWYKIPNNMQKSIMMMQMRSRKPCKLSAGRVYDMNMENFGNIVKTSMSYFTMFLSLRE